MAQKHLACLHSHPQLAPRATAVYMLATPGETRCTLIKIAHDSRSGHELARPIGPLSSRLRSAFRRLSERPCRRWDYCLLLAESASTGWKETACLWGRGTR